MDKQEHLMTVEEVWEKLELCEHRDDELDVLRAALSASPAGSTRQRGRMTKAAYEDCIDEDIVELHKLPRSLEREHIEHVLRHSVKMYYGE